MIVKIWNPLQKGWVWLDGVQSVEVSNKYCPHVYKTTKELSMVLIMEPSEKRGISKNLSCIFPCDYYLFDIFDLDNDCSTADILTEYESKYSSEFVYGSKIITIKYNNNQSEIYGLLDVSDVYLLNNEGKTIEHF